MRWALKSKSQLRLIQLKTLQKKWQMAHTDVRGTHLKKSGGHARFFTLNLGRSTEANAKIDRSQQDHLRKGLSKKSRNFRSLNSEQQRDVRVELRTHRE